MGSGPRVEDSGLRVQSSSLGFEPPGPRFRGLVFSRFRTAAFYLQCAEYGGNYRSFLSDYLKVFERGANQKARRGVKIFFPMSFSYRAGLLPRGRIIGQNGIQSPLKKTMT